MIKQLLLPMAGVAIFIILVGFFTQKSSKLNLVNNPPAATSSSQKTMTVGSKTVQVEIADTQSLRTKGLSGTTSLSADTGMLFIFEGKNVIPTFWMKDMLIPLDIIWIGNGKVVKIDKAVPPPASGTKDDDLTKYSTQQAVDYVLEVNAGFSDTNNIKVGDPAVL